MKRATETPMSIQNRTSRGMRQDWLSSSFGKQQVASDKRGAQVLRHVAVNEERGKETVPPIVHEVLQSPGQPLDPETRAFMEPRFGHDFSGVRVHTDAKAAESAQAVNALAYTVGDNVVFGTGQYGPWTTRGERLLAHELTHTIQQNGTAIAAGLVNEIAPPHTLAEQEAEHSAVAIVRNESVRINASPSWSMLQRQPQSEQGNSPPHKVEGGGPQGDTDNAQKSTTILDSFALNSDALTPNHLEAINALAWSIALHIGMLANGRATISITGHTDRSGDEKYNQSLGQRRADNVHASLEKALRSQKVSADRIAGTQVTSMGETKLRVDTLDGVKEPKNRRVEVEVKIELLPSINPPKVPDLFNIPPSAIPPTKAPFTPGKTPMVPVPQSEWLKDALEKDPLLRQLPGWANDKVVDALKDADELAADKIIDALPWGDKEKEAVKAAIKSLLQLMKGKRFQTPIPPHYEPPPSANPEFPKAPGEIIIKAPPIKF